MALFIRFINIFPMRYLNIAFISIYCAFFSDAYAYQQKFAVMAANGAYTVCHNVATPPTYALIGIATNSGCPNNTEYTVAPAQNGLQICNLRETLGGSPFKMPFPADYIVRSIQSVEYLQSKCGGATALYTIQPVAEGVIACSGSHIPEAWSYTSALPPNSSCGTTVRNELHQAVDGLRICTQSPYPNNFVIGTVESAAACGLQERYVLRSASDGIKACGPTHVPTGYVITGADRFGQCRNYSTLTLRIAYNGVVVCPSSPIPSRYVVEATVPYTGCEYMTTAYRLKYIP